MVGMFRKKEYLGLESILRGQLSDVSEIREMPARSGPVNFPGSARYLG